MGIDALSDRVARLENEIAKLMKLVKRLLKHVRIRRLFPKGTAGNWEPAEFEPPLSTVGECVAQKAISSLPESYALADGE